MSAAAFAAVDLGASSGRVMLGPRRTGHCRAGRGQPVPQRRDPAADGMYWDVLGLHQDILTA